MQIEIAVYVVGVNNKFVSRNGQVASLPRIIARPVKVCHQSSLESIHP
jgi:hypothetical protein